MSTILKALRRLEEDDAKSRDANANGEERPVAESADSIPKIPESAYAAADALANAASPRAEIPAESQQDGITLDRALSLARSRAVLAVATAVGLVALTFGAISLRDSGGVQLNAGLTDRAASSTASAQSPRSPARSPSRSLAPSPPAIAPAPTAIPVASPQSGPSSASASASSLSPSPLGSVAAVTAPTLAAPETADALPMRSRPTAPQVAKLPRSEPKPAPTTTATVVAAAVSPTRAAAAASAASAKEKIAEATQSLADRPVSRRPRAERLATPAPVSSADRDESIPLAQMLPMTAATPPTSTPSTSTSLNRATPQQTARAAIPKAPANQFDSAALPARAAEQLTPLAQARAMESAAAARASSSGRLSPTDSAAAPAPAVVEEPARAVADAVESAGPPRDRDVERIDRRGLPDVRVLRTSWHPQPDRRSAKVSVDANSKVLTLREGDAVGGLVVQTISPSSVLFESGGIEIRRRVGAGR